MVRELWERLSPPVIKGGVAYRRKRRTKRELIGIFNRGGYGMSPIIQTEVRDGADDVNEGIPYEITNVEEIVTDVKQYSGIRVSLLSPQAGEGNVVLWQRKVTGKDSKLGVFITMLGNNTDKWLHQWVIFKVWQDKRRELELTTAPSGKVKPVANK